VAASLVPRMMPVFPGETLTAFLEAPVQLLRMVDARMNSLLVGNRMQAEELLGHFQIAPAEAAIVQRFLAKQVELPAVLHVLARRVADAFGSSVVDLKLSYMPESDEDCEGLLITIRSSGMTVDDVVLGYDTVVAWLIGDRSGRDVARFLTIEVEIA